MVLLAVFWIGMSLVVAALVTWWTMAVLDTCHDRACRDLDDVHEMHCGNRELGDYQTRRVPFWTQVWRQFWRQDVNALYDRGNDDQVFSHGG